MGATTSEDTTLSGRKVLGYLEIDWKRALTQILKEAQDLGNSICAAYSTECEQR